MAKTFAETMNSAQLMMTALKTNLETLKKRGMTQEFIDAFEASVSGINAKNSEQERLKADLKSATAAIDTLLKQLDTQMKEAVKVVKLDIPPAQWKEFGILAKK
jgi:vancomycin resistance protein YoaR